MEARLPGLRKSCPPARLRCARCAVHLPSTLSVSLPADSSMPRLRPLCRACFVLIGDPRVLRPHLAPVSGDYLLPGRPRWQIVWWGVASCWLPPLLAPALAPALCKHVNLTESGQSQSQVRESEPEVQGATGRLTEGPALVTNKGLSWVRFPHLASARHERVLSHTSNICCVGRAFAVADAPCASTALLVGSTPCLRADPHPKLSLECWQQTHEEWALHARRVLLRRRRESHRERIQLLASEEQWDVPSPLGTLFCLFSTVGDLGDVYLGKHYQQMFVDAAFVGVKNAPADWVSPPGWPDDIPAPRLVPSTGDRLRIAFTMTDRDSADVILQHRCKFRGSGIVVSEVLTAQEQLEHTAPWPRYQLALLQGCKAQFKRSCLFVDGARVRRR
eukprot:360993-Chlamydomonas_euryale.AAC.4